MGGQPLPSPEAQENATQHVFQRRHTFREKNWFRLSGCSKMFSHCCSHALFHTSASGVGVASGHALPPPPPDRVSFLSVFLQASPLWGRPERKSNLNRFSYIYMYICIVIYIWIFAYKYFYNSIYIYTLTTRPHTHTNTYTSINTGVQTWGTYTPYISKAKHAESIYSSHNHEKWDNNSSLVRIAGGTCRAASITPQDMFWG